MFQGFASTAFVVGTLLTASIPAVGLARDRGGYAGRSAGSHSRSFSGGGHYNGGHSYVSPRAYGGGRGYSGRGPSYYGRGYVVPRYYVRPGYRGYSRGGFYLGFGAPYGYAYGPGYYDPGYSYSPGYGYDPGYSYGQVPAPESCAEGSYDQNGNWVANPDCYPSQQQYTPPQQNYAQPQHYNR